MTVKTTTGGYHSFLEVVLMRDDVWDFLDLEEQKVEERIVDRVKMSHTIKETENVAEDSEKTLFDKSIARADKTVLPA